MAHRVTFQLGKKKSPKTPIRDVPSRPRRMRTKTHTGVSAREMFSVSYGHGTRLANLEEVEMLPSPGPQQLRRSHSWSESTTSDFQFGVNQSSLLPHLEEAKMQAVRELRFFLECLSKKAPKSPEGGVVSPTPDKGVAPSALHHRLMITDRRSSTPTLNPATKVFYTQLHRLASTFIDIDILRDGKLWKENARKVHELKLPSGDDAKKAGVRKTQLLVAVSQCSRLLEMTEAAPIRMNVPSWENKKELGEQPVMDVECHLCHTVVRVGKLAAHMEDCVQDHYVQVMEEETKENLRVIVGNAREVQQTLREKAMGSNDRALTNGLSELAMLAATTKELGSRALALDASEDASSLLKDIQALRAKITRTKYSEGLALISVVGRLQATALAMFSEKTIAGRCSPGDVVRLRNKAVLRSLVKAQGVQSRKTMRGLSPRGLSMRVASPKSMKVKRGHQRSASTASPREDMKLSVSIADFELVRPISRGAFGHVFLARKRDTKMMYAIKVLKKSEMVLKNQEKRIATERDVMLRASNPFVVKLFWSFQSDNCLFLVMEFVQGGDLFSLLQNLGALEEPVARQYAAEAVLAIGYLHEGGVIHRDIKPDNMLIDIKGHIKLTDFGLSKIGALDRRQTIIDDNAAKARWRKLRTVARMATLGKKQSPIAARVIQQSHRRMSLGGSELPEKQLGKHMANAHGSPFSKRNRLLLHDRVSGDEPIRSVIGSGSKQSHGDDHVQDAVGTPHYMAPEVLLGTSEPELEHCQDWWALGIVLYEMLVGEVPFGGSTPEEVFSRVMGEEELNIPRGMASPVAEDLINKLLVRDPRQRLGAKGTEEIQAHPFFHGVDWEGLLDAHVAFQPRVDGEEDASYFDAREEYFPIRPDEMAKLEDEIAQWSEKKEDTFAPEKHSVVRWQVDVCEMLLQLSGVTPSFQRESFVSRLSGEDGQKWAGWDQSRSSVLPPPDSLSPEESDSTDSYHSDEEAEEGEELSHTVSMSDVHGIARSREAIAKSFWYNGKQ